MVRPPVALVVPILVLMTVANAEALVLCGKVSKKTGKVREGTPIRLRTECKTSEIELDPAELGLQGPPGVPGDDGEDGADGTNGLDGLACWDVDADHECDVDEDLVLPTGCGPEDCRGEDGVVGVCESRNLVFPSNGDSTCSEVGKSCLFVYTGVRLTNAPVLNVVSPLEPCTSNPSTGWALCCG